MISFKEKNLKLICKKNQLTYDYKIGYLDKYQPITNNITQEYSIALAIPMLLPSSLYARNPFISALFRSFEAAMIEKIATLQTWPINKETSERPDNLGVKSVNKTVFINNILPGYLPDFTKPIVNVKFFKKYINEVLFPKAEKYMVDQSIKLFIMKITPRFKEAVRATNWLLYSTELEKNFAEMVEASLQKYFTANPLSQIRGMHQEKIIQEILQCVQDDCKEPGKALNSFFNKLDSIIANNAYNPVPVSKKAIAQTKKGLFERGEQTTVESINPRDKKSDKTP